MRGATARTYHRVIFENSLEGVLISEAKTGVILECNTTLARQAGWKKSELVGKPRTTIFPDGLKRSQKPKHGAGHKRKTPTHTILLTKQGEQKPVERKTRQIEVDEQVETVDYIRFLPDQPTQSDTSNQILLNILDSLDADVYVADLQTFEILFANQHMRDNFGKKLEGKTCFKVFRNETARCSHCKNDLLVDKKGRPTGVHLWEGYNPVTRKWYSNADRAMQWHDGRLVRLQIAMDITERAEAIQELRTSEECYRDLVENIHDLICTHDSKGRVLSVNQAAMALTGYRQDEIIGRNLREFLVLESRELFDAYLEKIQTEGAAEGLMKIHTKAGETRLWHYHNTLRTDGPGETIVRAYASDVTEKKRAEDAIKASEQFLKLSQQIAHLGSWELDLTRNHLSWSDESFRIFGVQPGEFEATYEAFLALIYPDDREGVDRAYQASIENEGQDGYEVEYRIIRADDGEVRYVYDKWEHYRDPQGQIVKSIGMVHDITERKYNEQELFHSRQMLQLILDNVPQGIFWKDLNSRYLGCNQTFAQDAGLERPDQIIDKDDYELSWKIEADLYRTDDREVMEKGVSKINYEEPLTQKDGKQLWVRTSKLPLRDQDDNIFGVMGVYEDITERKRIEGELRRRVEELAALQDTLLGITSRHSLPELLNMIVERAVKLLDGSEGGMYLTEPEQRQVRCVVAYNTRQDFTGTVLAYGEGAGGLVAESGEPLIIDDYANWSGRSVAFEEEKPFHAIISTPLLWQGAVTGVLHVLRTEDKPKFTSEDLDLLRQFANHAAVAVENTRLYSSLTQELEDRKQAEAEIRRQMAELETLYETGVAVSRLLEPKAIGEKIITSFSQHLAWHHVTIRLRGNESDELELIAFNQPGLSKAARKDVEKKFTSMIHKVGQGLSGWVVQTGETIRLGNIKDDPHYIQTYPSILSGLYVPLKIGSRVIGSIAVESEKADAFSEANERLLTTLSAQVAASFENARLYQEVQQELVERKRAEDKLIAQTRELEALFSISTHLRSAQNADEMLPMVLDEMQRVLHTDSNAVLLLDDEKTEFRYALGNGAFQSHEELSINAHEGIGGRVYLNSEPYISNDYATEIGKSAHLPGTDNLGPALLVPLQSDTNFLGILIGAREKGKTSDYFSERELRLLSAVGEMVGNALRRMRLYDEVLNRMNQVQALHSVDMAIAASIDAKTALDIILGQVISHLAADAAAVLVFRPETQILEYTAALGFQYQEINKLQLWPGEGLAGKVVQMRQILSVLDLASEQNAQTAALSLEKLHSYHAVPMLAKGQVSGVLEIYYRQPHAIDESQIEFLEALASQAAIALDNAELFSSLQRSNLDLILAYDATIEGWSQALDLRNPASEGQIQRVTDLTLSLAREMGLQDELNQIRWGALLHDIGEIGVPEQILNKPAALTEEEWKLMREHPMYAYRMISPIEFLRPSLDIPYCHHEKWDGTGYPRGLKEEEIPLAARIFAVVDVWEALISDRPYRKAWSKEDAIEYIRSEKGKHFDPHVVEAFLRKIRSQEMEFEE